MSVRVVQGNALALPLDDSSVDLICTSPPYFGLRSYTDGGEHYAGQIGGEATPAEFVDALIAATAEMVRVLKPSGSIWVNLGDKYAGSNGQPGGAGSSTLVGTTSHTRGMTASRKPAIGAPVKSLIGIPWRYALRCIDDLGLILRAEVIWSKPNGLPESVTDRVRRSHETWFHFVREPRYFSAVDEIRESHGVASQAHHERYKAASRTTHVNTYGEQRGDSMAGYKDAHPLGKLPGSVWTIPTQPLTVPASLGVDHFAAFPMAWPRRIIRGWSPSGVCVACGEGRRPVVSSVALDLTRPQARRAQQLADDAGLTESHFRALLSVGVSDTGRGKATQTGTGKNTPEVYRLADHARKVLGGYAREYLLRRPSGFSYACACPEPTADTTPAVILDPFGGTGTTSLVAHALGRHGISVDMSRDYCRLAEWRTTNPGQLAAALQVTKPDAVPDGMESLFDLLDGAAS